MNREKAIKIVKEFINGTHLHLVDQEALETLIPELAESEDERMVRKIKLFLSAYTDKYIISEDEWQEIEDWLKKQKETSKAIEAIDRIDKFIDERLANAHDMKDSNPDKKYYRGWDDALGAISGILQNVYSEGKEKESLRDFIDNFPYSDEQKEQKDYRKLSEDITKSEWFKKAYEGKSLGCDDEQKSDDITNYTDGSEQSLHWRTIEDATTKRTDDGCCVTTEKMLIKGLIDDEDYRIVDKDTMVNRHLLCIPVKELNAQEKQKEQKSDCVCKDTVEIVLDDKVEEVGARFMRMRETKPTNIGEFLDRLTTVEQEFLWEHIEAVKKLDRKEKQKEQKPNIELIQRSWYMEGYHDAKFKMEPMWLIKTGESGPKYESNPRYGQSLEEVQKSAECSEMDEKIRKDIVALIKFALEDGSAVSPGSRTTKEEALAWLERQKEPKPEMILWTGKNLKEVIDFTGKYSRFDEWFKSWEEYDNYVHSHNNIFKLFCEDGSHYEVPVGSWIVKTPDGFNIPSHFKFVQNPAEIDEYKIIKKHITEDALSSEVNKRLKECGWYVTYEKPAEWSEEDKEILQQVIADIEDLIAAETSPGFLDKYNKHLKWLQKRFKSLRPQSHWKPSEKKYDGNMDKECIKLCDILNFIPSINTFESCCGHLKDRYSIWFFCNDIITISRLGRCVERNYSDEKWELLVDSTDTHPTGIFWLRSKVPFQSYDEMEKSVNELCNCIQYWFNTKFDSYFNGNSC